MKNVFELKSSWDTFSEHHRTTNHFSHCAFVGSSAAGLVDDVNWCRTRNNFLPNDWWISGAEQSCAIQVLFWMINSDPSPGLGAMELGTIIWWTLDIMINDLSICPHYNISDRRKVHSIIETSDRSVSSPWLLVRSLVPEPGNSSQDDSSQQFCECCLMCDSGQCL